MEKSLKIIFKQILRIQGNEVKVCNTSFHVIRHLHVYAHVYTYAFLFQWIWQDNTQFLQDNNIFEHTYFGWDILLTVWPKLLEIFQMNIHALYIHVLSSFSFCPMFLSCYSLCQNWSYLQVNLLVLQRNVCML